MIRNCELLDPIEEDILRRYFGLRPRLSDGLLLEPEPAQGATSTEALDDDDQPRVCDATRGVRLTRAELAEEDFPDIRIANATARICLNAIQGRLPDFARDAIVRTRRRDARRRSNIELLPRFLFSLNWADTGPGFSWPESYHVTFIPQFRRHVVTASIDSPDIWGCTDLAIGWFGQAEHRSAAVRRIIRRWWGFRWREHQQLRWTEFLSAGEVSSEEAERWCFRGWPSE